MHLYHIDRSNTLPFKKINLTQTNIPILSKLGFNEISQHGNNYLLTTFAQTFSRPIITNENGKMELYNESIFNYSHLWEFALEFIRSQFFPQFPSRFKCLFAVDEINNTWFSDIEGTLRIATLESSAAYKFDAGWFEIKTCPQETKNYYSPATLANLLDISYRYWNEEISPIQQYEWIVPLPCSIIKISNYIKTPNGIEEIK